MIDAELCFSAALWKSPGKSPWYFVTLPNELADQVRFFQTRQAGFSTVRVRAQTGTSTWKTSLFPDKKSGSYFLPVKADIRKKEALRIGDIISVAIKPLSAG